MDNESFTPRSIEPVEFTDATPPPKRDIERSDFLRGTSEEENPDDKPLALKGTPPLVDELDLMILYSSDIDGVKEKVAVVDSYIRHIMEKMELPATVGNYKKQFREIREDLDINEEATGMSQISLMFYYLRGKMDI